MRTGRWISKLQHENIDAREHVGMVASETAILKTLQSWWKKDHRSDMAIHLIRTILMTIPRKRGLTTADFLLFKSAADTTCVKKSGALMGAYSA